MTHEIKEYRVPAYIKGQDFAGSPSCAIFSIGRALAEEIVTLSAVVRSRGLYSLEKFDGSAQYLQHDPEIDPGAAAEAGDENDVSVEVPMLRVTKDGFLFIAEVKGTSDSEVETKQLPIAELAEHFGLVEASKSADNRDPGAPVTHVAKTVLQITVLHDTAPGEPNIDSLGLKEIAYEIDAGDWVGGNLQVVSTKQLTKEELDTEASALGSEAEVFFLDSDFRPDQDR